MSHIVTPKVRFSRLDWTEEACKALGWTLCRNQDRYRWYGSFMNDYPLPEGVKARDLGKCQHAIKVPGASYEIGLVEMPDGLRPVWDFYQAGHLPHHAGDILEAAYAKVAAEHAARDQGWLTERVGKDLLIHVPGQGTILMQDNTIDASGFTGKECLIAIMALGLPIQSATAKPEYNQAPVAVTQTR